MTEKERVLNGERQQVGNWNVASVFSRYGIYLFFALLLVVSGIFSPVFFSGDNLGNLLTQVAPLGIVVIGQAFVIIVRGLDLSVASVMATAAVVATSFDGTNRSVIPIIAVSLLMGLATGLVNGLLVTKRNVSPFLATLATMIVLQGIRFAYTQGAPSGNVPPFFRNFGSGGIGNIPYNIFVMLVLAVFFGVLLHFMTFGRKVFMTGGNPVAARLVGIRTDLITISCYVISSLLAAVAGLILSGFVGVVDNFVGKGFELDSIVAAVMGGVPLSGGLGTIPGGLVGAGILVVLSNIVLLLGLPVQLQIMMKGLVIIMAAAFYVRRTQK